MSLSDEEKQELKGLVNRNKSEIDDADLTGYAEDALKRKFDYPEWGLFFEVTGKKGKRVDAIAYNLYPSRNWKTVGLEIKASRSDWKSELEKASKNDWFVGQVDEFYVVAARKGIVKESELPEGWGLYVMKGGGKLYQEVESDLTEHQDREMDPEFYMRAVKKARERERNAKVSKERARKRGFRKGKKEGKKEGDITRDQKKMIEKGERFEELKDNLDIRLSNWHMDEDTYEKINAALHLIKEVDSDKVRSLRSEVSKMKEKNEQVSTKIESLEYALNDLEEKTAKKPEKGLQRFSNDE